MENSAKLAHQFKLACERRLRGDAELFSRLMNEAGPDGFSGLVNEGFDEVFGMAEQLLGGPRQDIGGPRTRSAERYARIFPRIVARDELVALTPPGFGDERVAQAFEDQGFTALAKLSRTVRPPQVR